MSGPFFDVFLPSLAGSAGNAGKGALQGMVEGQNLALDQEMKRAQIEEAKARASFQKSHAEHYGQKRSPQMEMLGLLAQVNPTEYERLMNDPNFLYSLVTKQSPFMTTPGGALNKSTQQIIPGTMRPTPENTPYTKTIRELSVSMFGKDPGMRGVTLSQEELDAVMKEDEARRTRIQSGITGEQLKQREKSPLSLYDKDFITTAKSLGINAEDRTNPLTPQQVQSVLDKMASDKAKAQELKEKEKPPKPLTMNEAATFASGIQAERNVDSVINRVFNPDGTPKDFWLLQGMVLNLPGTQARELYSNMIRAMAIMMQLRSGQAVSESEAKRNLDGYWPSLYDPDSNKFNKMRELSQYFKDSIDFKDPTGYYRKQLSETQGNVRPNLPNFQMPGSIKKELETPPQQQGKTQAETEAEAKKIKKEHPDWNGAQIYDELVRRGF